MTIRLGQILEFAPLPRQLNYSTQYSGHEKSGLRTETKVAVIILSLLIETESRRDFSDDYFFLQEEGMASETDRKIAHSFLDGVGRD